MKYIVYFFIILLFGCSMNAANNNVYNNKNKVSNVEFKINKEVGVQIND